MGEIWKKHFDEICFLCLGYAVGLALIAMGQVESGRAMIDQFSGATLMWLRGKGQ